MIEDLLAMQFAWPAVTDRVLVVGLGGGSDAIAAYAIAHGLGAEVMYGNTKSSLDADLVRIAPHIGRVPDAAAIRGTTKIERRLPRGAHGSPLVFALAGELGDELRGVPVDRVIGVDTGGDVLDASPSGDRGRDRRMLAIVRGLGVPVALVVLAPGADGQAAPDAIAEAVRAEHAAGRYRGAVSLAPYLPIFREHGRELGAERTPNVICRAFDDPGDPVEIPRGRRPRIPRAWLLHGLVFDT